MEKRRGFCHYRFGRTTKELHIILILRDGKKESEFSLVGSICLGTTGFEEVEISPGPQRFMVLHNKEKTVY